MISICLLVVMFISDNLIAKTERRKKLCIFYTSLHKSSKVCMTSVCLIERQILKNIGWDRRKKNLSNICVSCIFPNACVWRDPARGVNNQKG